MTRKSIVASKLIRTGALLVALCATIVPAVASDTKRPARGKAAAAREAHRDNLEKSVDDYKKKLEDLIATLEPQVEAKAAEAEKVKGLLESGIVSRAEVAKVELEVSEARVALAKHRKELEEADHLLNEAEWMKELAVVPPSRSGAYRSRGAVIRSTGGRWSIHDIVRVQGFYTGRFGRQLPISAYGQTDVHNRLGFDHRNSVDVPVHPDSAEGQAILAYLRNAGIPFLAFRGAVAGQSTGAHIHIGLPSSRLYR